MMKEESIIKAIYTLLGSVACCSLLISCTTYQRINSVSPTRTQASVLTDNRIVYRDLKKTPAISKSAYRGVMPNNHDNVYHKNVSNTVQRHVNDEYFVEFSNDSSLLKKRKIKPYMAALRAIKEDQKIVLIGNSHGRSNVGTGSLAQKRADSVFYFLVTHGIDKSVITRLASWNDKVVEYAPKRGVQIKIVSKTNIDNIVLSRLDKI